MTIWLATVCAILANDLGMSENRARTTIAPYLDLAREAYDRNDPADDFAFEFVCLIERRV